MLKGVYLKAGIQSRAALNEPLQSNVIIKGRQANTFAGVYA